MLNRPDFFQSSHLRILSHHPDGGAFKGGLLVAICITLRPRLHGEGFNCVLVLKMHA